MAVRRIVDGATGAESTEDMVPPTGPDPASLVQAELAESDRQMARVAEDVLAALHAKGVILETELPAETQSLLARRRQLRQQAGS